MTTPATPEQAPSKPISVESSVRGLLALIEDFSIVLERETEALKEHDFISVDALQPQKTALARQYTDSVTSLTEQREAFITLDEGLRTTLINKRTDFTKVLDINLRVLNATKASAERLATRIRETALKSTIDQRQTHYSSGGQVGSWNSAAMSLRVDQQL